MGELPFFKFVITDWYMGRIQRLNKNIKGAFVDLMAIYWHNECELTLEDALIDVGEEVQKLIDAKIIKESGGELSISFLDEQYCSCLDISTKRSEAGSKGGKAKAKQVLASAKQNVADKDKEEDKIKSIVSKDEFLEYGLKEIGSLGKDPKDYLYSLGAKYDSWAENDWKDGHNKKIKNWKTKLRNTIPHLKPVYGGTEDGKIEMKQYLP